MGFISTVSGRIAPGDLGLALAAETLVSAGPARLEKLDLPAGEVAFAREAVGIRTLGRLAMGAPNLDDLRLDEAHAEAALRAFAAAGGGSVVVLAGGSAAWTPAQLVALAERTGVAVVRGALPGDPWLEGGDGAAAAAGGSAATPAGIVGRVPLAATTDAADAADTAGETAAALDAAIAAAVTHGLPLALDASAGAADGASLARLERALGRAEAAGLARSRVLVAGAASLIVDEAARVGTDPARVDALIATGAICAFDDLGRLPTVRTVVSDHDVAMTTLAFARAGAAERVVFSSGITQKHRLTAFGGNGLEFVPQQFLPYLRGFGADDALVAAVGGANLAALLTVPPAPGPPPAPTAQPAPTRKDV